MPTVTSNGARIRYIREGAGDPVILLHGYLFGAEWWRPQIDALRDRFDVVAIDLRGQGESEPTASQAGYDLWNQVEDVRGVATALGIGSCHFVGLSMGGFISLRMALRHPEMVRSLVLMDTSAESEEPDRIEANEGMAAVVEAGAMEKVLPALPPVFFADDFITGRADVVDEWLGWLSRSDPGGLLRALRGLSAREDISGRLGEIRVPTLVIHGEQDVPIPVAKGERIAKGISGARLELVGGGHQSNVDRPEATSRLIRAFLLGPATASGAMIEDRATTAP